MLPPRPRARKKRKLLSPLGWAWVISVVLYIVMRQYPRSFSFLPMEYYEDIRAILIWFAAILFALYVYDERWFRPKK